MYKSSSAHALCQQFKEGKLSAALIAEKALKRLYTFDPQLDAFLSVCSERFVHQAKQLDLKRLSGQPLGRLAGVPIAIKDNIHVQGEISTCGSRFLANYKAPSHATVVRLLEAEDALILGKTNMDEFAMGSSTENSAYKTTQNPWDLSCVPGGSSGGSAAAVASRICPLSLGSDTGGSVRQPAAFCGIVGFKPTYGRFSRSGLVAYASSFDQVGTFATNVADTALLLDILGRHCPKDSTSLNAPPLNTFTEHVRPIQGTTIGVPWNFLENLSQDAKESFLAALDVFKAQGAAVVNIDLDILKYSIAIYYVLVNAEASTNLARFDGIRYGHRSDRAKTLEEVYEYSKQEGFGPEVKNRILLGTFVLSSGYQDAYYKKAQKVRTLVIEKFKEAFTKCAVIALPTSPFSAFKLGSISDPLQMYLQDIYTICANLAGLPAISIPCGFDAHKKPFGLQLLGPQQHDCEVLRFAHAFEAKTAYHTVIPPLFDEEL